MATVITPITIVCAECKGIDQSINRETVEESAAQTLYDTNRYAYFCSSCIYPDATHKETCASAIHRLIDDRLKTVAKRKEKTQAKKQQKKQLESAA